VADTSGLTDSHDTFSCPRCGASLPPDAGFCPTCGADLRRLAWTSAEADEGTSLYGTRDQWLAKSPSFVYPTQPPKSTALCLLNFLLPGVAQIVLGQVSKGILIMIGVVAALFTINCVVWAIWLGSVVDAYMVAHRLQRGVPVEKMRFFPD
jgi:TM2 domain-containing membrane protein YozV